MEDLKVELAVTEIVRHKGLSIDQTVTNIHKLYQNRIKELEKAASELYDMVHESQLDNRLRANELYEIIKP